MSVWPSGCVCQLLRAPGSKVTYAPLERDGAGALNSWSMRTVPVKYSAGPRAEGCDPLRLSSICRHSSETVDESYRALPLWRDFVRGGGRAGHTERVPLPRLPDAHRLGVPRQ